MVVTEAPEGGYAQRAATPSASHQLMLGDDVSVGTFGEQTLETR